MQCDLGVVKTERKKLLQKLSEAEREKYEFGMGYQDLKSERDKFEAKCQKMKENCASLEAKKTRAEADNNELRAHLAKLQQSQNISGEFPLRYQALQAHTNAINEFQSIYFDITDSDTNISQKLSRLTLSMLCAIANGIQARFHSLCSAMLFSLGGVEDPAHVSDATTSFMEVYCQRHWEKLLLEVYCQENTVY